MSEIVTINKTVENKVIDIRGQVVILDSDVAMLYDVETKRINEAVKNNPEKFPEGYILELTDIEWKEVRSKISTSPLGGGRTYKAKVFTEKGLYMLATILKSSRATSTTIAIVETFAKVREATRAVAKLFDGDENNPNAEKLSKKIGTLMGELILPDADDYEVESVKTSAKIKFLTMFEFTKETIRKPKKK